MYTTDKLPLDQKECFGKRGLMSIPYRYFAGVFLSRALITLRDEKRILGARCEKCDKVYFPPRNRCEKDFSKMTELVEIGPEGTVEEFTVVNYEEEYFNKFCPMLDIPYTMALIKLDGASTKILHRIPGEVVKRGDRVRPKWLDDDKREAMITDIEYFEKV
jgi:uncharacterized OB-fold protein